MLLTGGGASSTIIETLDRVTEYTEDGLAKEWHQLRESRAGHACGRVGGVSELYLCRNYDIDLYSPRLYWLLEASNIHQAGLPCPPLSSYAQAPQTGPTLRPPSPTGCTAWPLSALQATSISQEAVTNLETTAEVGCEIDEVVSGQFDLTSRIELQRFFDGMRTERGGAWLD